jgi:DnaJ-class molecular chaperone
MLCCAVLQVLSNPELRAKYDKYGSAALDVEFADPSLIFGMLFGSELFEPIVGEFLIAAATSKGRELTEKEINHMQVGLASLVRYLGGGIWGKVQFAWHSGLGRLVRGAAGSKA